MQAFQCSGVPTEVQQRKQMPGMCRAVLCCAMLCTHCFQVFSTASLMAGKALMGSLWAAPSGSGMTSSMTPNLMRSGAVMRSASVAWSGRQEEGGV